MRLLLTLQYLGTRYAGWQAQTNAVGIQTVVEEALGRLYGGAVRIEGAGRTDAGVHAAAQRAHFDPPFEIPLRGLLAGVNDLLPHDIRVKAVEPVADSFHCRFDATSKSYAYRIWNAPVMDVFHWETHAHVAAPLARETMAAAAAGIVGTHDFRAFTVAGPEVSSTVRTLTAISVAPGTDGRPSIEIRVTANGFLRYMVRRIAGSLIEVGRGKLPPDGLSRSLVPTFEPARWTAPAKGLVLEEIRY